MFMFQFQCLEECLNTKTPFKEHAINGDGVLLLLLLLLLLKIYGANGFCHKGKHKDTEMTHQIFSIIKEK